MRLRTRLSLAFFVVSVLPLAVVTAYSYYTSAAALRRAVEVQADQMAAEMGDRMTWVMSDLGDRVERLWRMRVEEPVGGSSPQQSAGASAPEATANMQGVAKAMLAEAAPLVQRLEFASSGASTVAAPERQARVSSPGREAGRGRTGASPPPAEPGEPGMRGMSGMPGPPPGFAPGTPGNVPAPRGVPVIAPGMPRIVIDMRTDQAPADASASDAAFEALTPDAVNAWRRAIQRQIDRESNPDSPPGQGRGMGRRGDGLFPPGAAPQPSRPGPPQPPGGPSRPSQLDGAQAATPRATGAEMAARAQAERARRKEERQQQMTALAHGEALQFQVRRAGEVIGAINATVDRNRLIETVLSLGRRDRGEIPFVMDEGGKVHTIDTAAAETVRALALDAAARAAHASSATELEGDYLIVTRRDPSGIVFGLARPIRDSLRDMRRASLANLAVGLLLIAGAFAIILPLASRLTRHITALNAGVQKVAAGDRRARVEVDTPDEIGELARSFNRMASELESHDQILVKQERLARELELCRQIQNDMLPHGPLRIGPTEVAGVSVPAREVGGDFFNYFALEDGRIALLVGDVSGKGVGAALLMANIQATLRAKLQLESDLARLVEGVDLDIAANTPPEVYITLFVGLLDPVRRGLRYVNAGHNPQFLLRAGGRIERLDSTGLPVGLLPGRGYEERRVQVDPGDLLFLYTDGTVEVPNEAGAFFDADRLQRVLVAASAAGVDEVLVRVEQAIREFRGRAELADDATMMALRLGAPA